MTRSTFLTWFPRILAILFAGFITIFALDSFEGHDSWIQKLGHLLVHLLPTAAVIGLLCLAWRRRIIGGLAFMILGMIFTIHFGTWRETQLFLLFSMPLFITGVGFIFSRYGELNAGKN
jgi:hypothetical protein